MATRNITTCAGGRKEYPIWVQKEISAVQKVPSWAPTESESLPVEQYTWHLAQKRAPRNVKQLASEKVWRAYSPRDSCGNLPANFFSLKDCKCSPTQTSGASLQENMFSSLVAFRVHCLLWNWDWGLDLEPEVRNWWKECFFKVKGVAGFEPRG